MQGGLGAAAGVAAKVRLLRRWGELQGELGMGDMLSLAMRDKGPCLLL